TVNKLKAPNDRLCAVVFDELSIKPLLSCNKKTQYYANVFLLKGIHRQWKQAVTFTFSYGPIKTNKLKALLVDVIKESQRIGLEVVVTVCDQGGANQAAEHTGDFILFIDALFDSLNGNTKKAPAG
ncbi:unnamed protein product, partial [Tenebrio molitor]